MKKMLALIASCAVCASAVLAMSAEVDVDYFYTFANTSQFRPSSAAADRYEKITGHYDSYYGNRTELLSGSIRNPKDETLTVTGENVGVDVILTFLFSKPTDWLEVGLNLGGTVAWYSQISTTDNNNLFTLFTTQTDGAVVANGTGVEWSAIAGPAFRFRTVEKQYVYFSPGVRSTWNCQIKGKKALNYVEYDETDYTFIFQWDLGLNFNIGYRMFFPSKGKVQFGFDAGANFGVRLFGTTHTAKDWYIENYKYEYSIYSDVTGGFSGNIYFGVCVNFGK